MNKKLSIEVSVVIVAAVVLGGLVYYRKTQEVKIVAEVPACAEDVMMCPDGTSVGRSGSNCEFGVCKQVLPTYLQQPAPPESTTTPPVQVQAPTTFFKKITTGATSLFKQAQQTTNSDITTGTKDTATITPTGATTNTQTATQPTTQQGSVTTPSVTTPSNTLNETRYTVNNNTIVDSNNTIIYTLPSSSANSSSGYTNIQVVNVVPVNNIAPVIGAIPVEGLPGKYYLSENSFNANSACKFSNKIYILDTKNNTQTLMYEENSETLSLEDPRACTSEMFLLATEQEKLILKYHTVGTNMVCESTWSEPEKTWYLDVTKPTQGTKRYPISYTLYQEAEVKEEACRALIEASSTPQSTTTETGISG